MVQSLNGPRIWDMTTNIHSRLPVDLVPLPTDATPSAEADNFIGHMQQVHDEAQCHIAASKESNKQHVDTRHGFVELTEGEMVMVRIQPTRLPPKANNK